MGKESNKNVSALPTYVSTASRKPFLDVGSRTKSVILLLGAIALLAFQWHSSLLDRVFDRFSPSTYSGIAWHSCPDLTEYDCAYLTVPLDYTDPIPNETVSLALRRLPATAPKKERMGTLFINPGGPGASGTAYLVHSGPEINIILKGRYDILSWDTRGVNMTTPAMGCFPTEFDEYMQEWKQGQLGLPFEARATSNDLAWFEKTDAYFRSTVASCKRNGNKKLLESVSTAFVVRDMVRILEALGEDKLKYWGFSYGTILGATFSAMFPDLVHRVLLDGVSSAKLYTEDMFEWGRSGMDDTNKVWDGFLSECARAGPAKCALARMNGTAEDVLETVDALTERLITAPLAVPFAKTVSGIVTASDVRKAIFKALYKPNEWANLATALADADKGDGIALLEFIGTPAIHGEPALDSRRGYLDNIFNRHMTRSSWTLSNEAIMCADTAPTERGRSPSASAFRDYSRELGDLSITGETWASFVGRCRFWNSTAKEAYRGPWTVEDGLKKTNFPVLFLGVTADPVTPLSAAKSMSAGFGSDSATLLVQKGYGHCSHAHPSLCSAKTIAKYFLEGKVPEYGATCESDEGYLFATAEEAEERMHVLSEEDRELTRAMERLSKNSNFW